MEHTVAISSTLIPILLAVIGAEFALMTWQLKRFLDRNEHDHDQFFARTNEHDRRLTRVESDVEHLNRTSVSAVRERI